MVLEVKRSKFVTIMTSMYVKFRKSVHQNQQFHLFLLIINWEGQKQMLQDVLKEKAFKEIDVVVKCKKYPEFKKQLIEIQQNYLLDLKMTSFTKIKNAKDTVPFQIVNRNKLFVNFYGYSMNGFKDEDFRDLYLQWIEKMDNEFRAQPTRRFTIIYYHSMSASTSPYIFIKDSFKKLPIQYYALLDKIYIVESSFFLRNADMFEFGRLHKLYSRRLAFVQNIKELGKIVEIQKNQILQGIPEVLSMEQSIEGDKKAKKEDKNSKKIEPPSPLRTIVQKKDCLTIPLSSHKLSEKNIPIYLEILINTIRNNPDIMSLEGIFRKSGSIQEEEEIIIELSKMQKVGPLIGYETKSYSGFAVAGVTKKLFTKLQKPIVPYAVYNWIMGLNGISEEQQTQIVREILISLPELNREIILYVLRFIRNEVLEHKQANKMNFYNMSVVFSPCFFRPEVQTFQDLLNSGRYASILKILFTKFDTIVGKEDPSSPSKKGQNQNRGSKGSRGSKESKGQGQSSLKPLNTNI